MESSTHLRIAARGALIVAALLVIAGCSGAEEAPSGGDDVDQPRDEANESADEPMDTDEGADSADDSMASSGEADLHVGGTSLGSIIVDADGHTLYIFEPDEQGPSTCTGGCAASWPPHTIDGEPVLGAEVDATLVGTAERDDGTQQLTYDGWPLYRWVSDSAPGDVTGQGVQDVWWVIAPDGTVIRDAEAAAASDDTDMSDGTDESDTSGGAYDY
ncbi:MAG: hypothetical protein WD011_08200 [Nitriliruptoraceae bacterium]